MSELGRRAFLRATGCFGLLVFANPIRLRNALTTQATASAGGRFLTAAELNTLRAVTARFLPGPPEDADPGAVDAGCAEAIDMLLDAFSVDPPLIHAGGPFSDRAGATHDDFADFIPLDAHAELGWRIRLEGSQGKAEREFAGPVVGLQEEYRTGLAHLNDRAKQLGAAGFASLPTPLQIAVMSDQTDSDVQSFVGTALSNTLEAMYGPPEYRGNKGLVGWTSVGWQGDTQPRGFTAAEVSNGGVANTSASRDKAIATYKRFVAT